MSILWLLADLQRSEVFYAFHSNPCPPESLNPKRSEVSKWDYQPFSSITTTNGEMIQKQLMNGL